MGVRFQSHIAGRCEFCVGYKSKSDPMQFDDHIGEIPVRESPHTIDCQKQFVELVKMYLCTITVFGSYDNLNIFASLFSF